MFAVHLLGNDDSIIEASLEILMTLGGSSAATATRSARSAPDPRDRRADPARRTLLRRGAPREGVRPDENTIFLGDVVAAERLNPGGRLNIGEAWSKLPPQWIEEYERNHVPQMEHARRCRERAASRRDGHGDRRERMDARTRSKPRSAATSSPDRLRRLGRVVAALHRRRHLLRHFYGTFRGPTEIQQFLESTMSFAPHVYSPLVWYNVDGSQIVYKVVNRADNPEPGKPPIEFPSLQIITYAGDGRWASEEDWWIKAR